MTIKWGNPPKRPGYGTSVLRPSHHYGSEPYSTCNGCGLKYTKQGIANHWRYCPELVPREGGGYEPRKKK